MKCSVATPEIKASVHYPVGTRILLLIKVAFYLPLFLLLLFFLPACQVIFLSFDVHTHTNTRMYRKRERERRRGRGGGGGGGGEQSTCTASHIYGKAMLVVHTGAVSLPGDKQQETQTEKEMGDGAITGLKMKTSESQVFC